MRIKCVTTDMSRDDYVFNLCRKRGFKRIGSGINAIVYAKRGCKTVIKVGCGFDDPYLKYVQAIGLQSRNPMFPKIISVTVYNTDWDQYYVVEMERLLPFWTVNRPNLLCEKKYGIDIYELDSCHYLSKVIRTTKTNYIKQTLRILKRLFNRYGADMHTGNIMWRKRGERYQLVITDPIA